MVTVILDLHPLVTLAVMVLLSPGSLVAIAILVERRWTPPRDQYAAFLYGDLALAVAATAAAAMWSAPWLPIGGERPVR